jgi:hypothetical protein
MYHSEATLLQDGRVLVSGSDPEDPNYPQEYRVEVFLPPYLLSGLARPSYTIQNTDWAYGESVQIVVTGGAATVVSLIGAQSSTHGNAMGQRTIFPAFSCAGNTCTITAPPNVTVSPRLDGSCCLFLMGRPRRLQLGFELVETRRSWAIGLISRTSLFLVCRRLDCLELGGSSSAFPMHTMDDVSSSGTGRVVPRPLALYNLFARL